MKTLKNKNFLRFLVPSLIGVILFVTPISQGGNLTIPIAVAANMLLDLMGDSALTIIWILISLSAILTIIHKTVGIGLLKQNPKLDNLFSVKGFWFAVRMIGLVFANMIYFNIGPDFIIGGAKKQGSKVVKILQLFRLFTVALTCHLWYNGNKQRERSAYVT